MPFVSLVVPVYQVEAFLPDCLDSVLEQDFTDFELIAVDDRTPDSGGEIIDGYAAREPRVRPLHLPANSGLGPARNAGLAQARGEYVWFLDGDDRLAPGALAAVAGRLRDLKPDLLVVDYAREHLGGRLERSSLGPTLAAAPEEFSVEDYPSLLGGFCVAWNKVMRTQFLASSGLSFPPGWYEDIPVTYPLLDLAERISTLDRVCVYYRQRRRGSILGTRSPRHAELLDQYALALSRLGPGPTRDFVRREAVHHGKQLLGAGGRLPPAARRAYFERLAAFADAHGEYGRDIRDFLLRHRFWGGYRAVAAGRGMLRKLRARVKRGVPRVSPKALARKVKRGPGLAYYWWQRRKPLQELAVYSSYWGRAYECNPAAIHAAAARLAPHVRSVWTVRKDQVPRLPAGVTPAVIGSFAYYRALARATWLFNNANFEGEIVKRPGTVHVQTHHGTPLKFMGVDEPVFRDDPAQLSKLLKRCDRWDFSLVTNRYSERVWRRAYPCDFEFLEYGYPRNDVLVNASAEDVAARRAAYPDGLLVLYAPTHRPYAFQRELDIPGATVIAKPHYFDGGQRGPSIEELMLVSDVLVTDYSSVMFDYALLDRPIVIYAPDWDEYVAERGVYFDLLASPPGVVVKSVEDLRLAFASGAVWRTGELRAAFRQRFCQFDDGHAAERVVRRVILGEESP